MTTRTEKLANNYVWKSKYDKEYKEKFDNIDWKRGDNSDKWEEVKTESGKTILRLKK